MSEVSLETRLKQTPSRAVRNALAEKPTSASELGKPPSPAVAWRRALGNRAIGRMLQTKPEMNQPGSACEQEADRVADQVVRSVLTQPGPAADSLPGIQRKCAPCANSETSCSKCDAEEKEVLQRKEIASAPVAAPSSVHEVMNSPGKPLDYGIRGFMEERFGRSFGQVRIHDDERAA